MPSTAVRDIAAWTSAALTIWAGGSGQLLQRPVGVSSGGTPTQFPDRLSVASVTYAKNSTPTSGTRKSLSTAVHWTSAFRRFVLGALRAAQGAGPRVAAGRCRPNEAHANPATHAHGADRDVFSCCPVLGDARDHTLTGMHPSDQTGSTSVSTLA